MMSGKYYKFLATLFILWLFLVVSLYAYTIFDEKSRQGTVPIWNTFVSESALVRTNENTGETWLWEAGLPGWLKIRETSLVTSFTEEEKVKRKVVFEKVYSIYKGERHLWSFMRDIESILKDFSSSQIEEVLEKYFKSGTFSDSDFRLLERMYDPEFKPMFGRLKK